MAVANVAMGSLLLGHHHKAPAEDLAGILHRHGEGTVVGAVHMESEMEARGGIRGLVGVSVRRIAWLAWRCYWRSIILAWMCRRRPIILTWRRGAAIARLLRVRRLWKTLRGTMASIRGFCLDKKDDGQPIKYDSKGLY